MTRKFNKMAAENVGCCCSKAPSKSKMSDFQVFAVCESSSSVRRGSDLFLLLRIGRVTAVILTVAAILGNLHHVAAQNQYGGGMVDQKFAMEPQDQTAIVGSRVTLPCRVVGKSGVLQWTKDDFGLGAHRNLSGYERYSMIGSDEEGDFSLDIFPVQLDDDAKYQCQVSAGPLGQPAIRSRFASISVLVPPEAPKILQGSLLQATEDQPIELECVSAGGKPAAEITWIDGEGTVLSARAKHSVLPTADGRRFTARSVLRLVPKRAQHGGTLACQAQNTADRTFRAAVIKLEVKYAPVVSVKILGGAASNGRIPEGAEVRLGCKAEANPNDLTYRWFLNDDLVVGDYTTEMVLYNVSRKLHDSIVKCEVHNAVGKSEESETLDVTYGPRFRSPPTDVAADLGGEVTLSCDLDGNPPPAITWLHEDQDRWSVVGSTPNLTLTVDSATAGRYNCKAAVHGFPEIEADAVVYLKGPPKIVSPRSQIGMEGDSARIECRVISVPRPVHLMWSHAGKEINIHTDQDFSILEDPMADGVKSTLVIRDSQYMHFGTYNCSVTNEYGSDVVEIQLVAQSSFPLQMITFILIGGAVIIPIIALAIVLFICARRKSKQRAGKEMGGKPDVMVDAEHKDRTSYISDLKHDLKMEEACNPEYSGEEFRTGLPLAGPVPLPADRAALLMQYSRYSNDYSDHAFPPNIDFKDGHNNNAYSGYIDYSRDYNPPPSLPLHVKSPSINGMDSQSASRLHLGSSYRSPSSGGDSLQRRGVGGVDTTDFSYPSGSLQRRKADANSIGIPSVTYDTVGLLQHPNGALKQNGSGMLTPNGVDIRYAATYGNPYLRTAGGLSTVNTANPAATPAPPPYNSIRNSLISMMPSGSNPHISGSTAQPQAAPQSPASKYIMPVVAPNPAQMVQLTKKGTGTQQSLATHV